MAQNMSNINIFYILSTIIIFDAIMIQNSMMLSNFIKKISQSISTVNQIIALHTAYSSSISGIPFGPQTHQDWWLNVKAEEGLEKCWLDPKLPYNSTTTTQDIELCIDNLIYYKWFNYLCMRLSKTPDNSVLKYIVHYQFYFMEWGEHYLYLTCHF